MAETRREFWKYYPEEFDPEDKDQVLREKFRVGYRFKDKSHREWHLAKEVTLKFTKVEHFAKGLTQELAECIFRWFLDEGNWEEGSWVKAYQKYYLDARPNDEEYVDGDDDDLEEGDGREDFQFGCIAIADMLDNHITADRFYSWLHTHKAIEEFETIGLSFPEGRGAVMRHEMIGNLAPLLSSPVDEFDVQAVAKDSGHEFTIPTVTLEWIKTGMRTKPLIEAGEIPPFGDNAYLRCRTFRFARDTVPSFWPLAEKLYLVDQYKQYMQERVLTPEEIATGDHHTLTCNDAYGQLCRTWDISIPERNIFSRALNGPPGFNQMEVIVKGQKVPRWPLVGPDYDVQILRLEIYGLPVESEKTTENTILYRYMSPIAQYLKKFVNIIESFAAYKAEYHDEEDTEMDAAKVAECKVFDGRLVFAISPQLSERNEDFNIKKWEAYCRETMPGFVPFEGEFYPIYYPGRIDHCINCRAIGFDSHVTQECPKAGRLGGAF